MTSVLLLMMGLAAAIAAFFAGRGQGRNAGQAALLESERRSAEAVQAAVAEGAAERSRANALTGALKDQADAAVAREAVLRNELAQTADALRGALSSRAALEAELKSERAASLERVETAQAAARLREEDFAKARANLAEVFKNTAQEILEDKSKRFTEHSRSNIEQLLTPLREKLGEFATNVDGLRKENSEGRGELRGHIETLRGLNEKLSTDANNLVKALRNSSKQQGDWGEVLLIRMLEDAGLRAGSEYRVQESFANEEGRHVRPDIILNLPDDKHLVVDSKVSLVAYADHCAAEEDGERKAHLERHALSLRQHIDGLSKKNYQTLHQLRSLDFVVMFVPIEAAYLLALAHDPALWQRAWSRDVLLVSPGTLFPVMRTIAHMWQQERQTRNVEEIVRQGGALYDKVATFAAGFQDVGRKLEAAGTAYDKAYAQLATGKGHVLGRVEKLRSLGVRATKQMPRELVDSVEGLGLDAGDEAELGAMEPGADESAPPLPGMLE